MQITTVELLIFMAILSPKSAYAYLDPGTGSFLTQIIAASIISLLVFLRLHWRKLLTVLTSSRSKNIQDDSRKANTSREGIGRQ